MGVLNTKGKYIKFFDSDDLLLQILHICYYYAEKYKIDIIVHNILYKRRNKTNVLEYKHPNKVSFN